ncbi:hypothetical protein CDL15_Pgr008547 [Punica granatum]|uniref:Uncharacterized protein n=1 Tax=Punica granatum TaxID=22663 RepID=A0A218WN20_PUNGR|nr:hypothetical protein CDL15_Pgr008547 [Punica granatum]
MSTPASEWESLYHRNGDGQGVVLKCGSERQEASSELGDVNEFEIHKVAMARGGANEEAGGAIAPPEL